MIFSDKTLVAPKLNKPTATTIMLILKGKNTDGAHWLRLVVAYTKKQDRYIRSFYQRPKHSDGGIPGWLSRDYFTITKGKATQPP